MVAKQAKTNTSEKASSNWLALQKKLKPGSTSEPDGFKQARKPRKDPSAARFPLYSKAQLDAAIPVQPAEDASFPRGPEEPAPSTSAVKLDELKNGESLEVLRKMIQGDEQVTETKKKGAKKYIAIDCEMVGVGNNGGEESSLARVSVVNYYGAVELDELVQQRERVVDYRTRWSGIRPRDMVRARPFEEVQKKVADLIDGKVLVGHAVHNDLKALLLSHPHFLIRDTQALAGKHSVVKSRVPALRHLVEHEFGVSIQSGEHSSVVDARATMAIFRLHRKAWESGLPKSYFMAALHYKQPAANALASDQQTESEETADTPLTGKRKARPPSASDEEPVPKIQKTHASPESASGPRSSNTKRHPASSVHTHGNRMTSHHRALSGTSSSTPSPKQFPGGGRKGVSSGLSTVVQSLKKGSWWKNLD